jgi:hypothetical protein
VSKANDAEKKGYLSIALKKAKSGSKKSQLERIRGTIKYGSLEEVYSGIKPARVEGHPVKQNIWELILAYPSYDSDYESEEDAPPPSPHSDANTEGKFPCDIDRVFSECSLIVLDVEDDTGFPFVEIDWYVAGSGSRCGYLIAKRCRDGAGDGQLRPWELSDAERERLGMGLTRAQVESRDKAKAQAQPKIKARVGRQTKTASSSKPASNSKTVAGTKRKGDKDAGSGAKKVARKK